MVVVDISGVLGRWPLLGGPLSSWSWLTSLVFSVDATSRWSPFVMVVVDISGVLGRRPLLGGAHSS